MMFCLQLGPLLGEGISKFGQFPIAPGQQLAGLGFESRQKLLGSLPFGFQLLTL